MAKRKVIEDSDDEGEEPVSPPAQTASGLTDLVLSDIVNLEDSPATAPKVLQPADPSTSSIERLNRDIQDAHRALMELTPNGSNSITEPISLSQQPQASPSMSKQKRRRASSAAGSPSPRAKKAAKMYGSEKAHDKFEFNVSRDIEIEKASRRPKKKPKFRSQAGEIYQDMAVKGGMSPPSTKPSLGEHAKSSESNATSTAMHPALARPVLGNCIPIEMHSTETSRSFETTDSDRRMPTPTVSSMGRSDREKTSSREETDAITLQNINTALQTRSGTQPQEEPNSSASMISPSKTITVEQAATRKPSFQDEDLDADELSRSSPIFHGVGTIAPIVLLPGRAPDMHRLDEAMDDGKYEYGHTLSDKSKKSKKPADHTADELGSDDIAMGIFKEQYQPRPSRSRCGLESKELAIPIDFSKKPEAAVKPKRKRKSKRAMTVALQELLPPKDEDDEGEDEDEDEDVQVRARVKRDVAIPKEDLLRPVDGIVKAGEKNEEFGDEGGMVSESVVENQQPRKQRGRPKKAVKTDEETKAVVEPAPDLAEKEKAKPAKITKKLGKKRKETSAALVHDDEESSHNSEADPTVEDFAVSQGKVFKELTGNESNLTAPGHSPDVHEPSREIAAAPETPKKPSKDEEKGPEKGPDKHSPISSGKVAYRVGLSKRARIEPLLRIVRK